MIIYLQIILFCVFFLSGCETAHKATSEAGTYVGKGAQVIGGATEGAVDGYQGPESPEENPFDR